MTISPMSILYNTNSSLIPKFQRNNLHRETQYVSRPNVAFNSKYEKNSDEYLKELCDSVWPKSLRTRIGRMNKMELAVNSFAALMVRNFMGWYGTKIPTSDDQFLILLFDLIQDLTAGLRDMHIDYECLLADELPMILSEHLKVMRRVWKEQNPFEQYCKLTLYQDEYPQLITRHLKLPLENGSCLQSDFLEALFDDLIWGKVMDRALEPYFILHAITKLSVKTSDKHVHYWSLQKLKQAIASSGKILARMFSVDKKQAARQQQQQLRPFLHRYAFTFLLEDLSMLHHRKPGLFAIAKTLQYWATKSSSIDVILHNLFYNFITTRLTDRSNWQHFFLTLRQLLFPNDSEMGPSANIAVGAEFEALKIEARDKLWQVIQSKYLDLLLGTTQGDVNEWIEILSKDKRCNKLFCFRIINCLLAQ
ncbi:YDR179W-A [Zygosaccharomyces parabailii]|nr:YDR179W-A [Zygosaccharomyces parabailii]